MVVGAATLDGYRRQVLIDKNDNKLNEIEEKRKNELEKATREEYQRMVEEVA
jgi:hypothetical protein